MGLRSCDGTHEQTWKNRIQYLSDNEANLLDSENFQNFSITTDQRFNDVLFQHLLLLSIQGHENIIGDIPKSLVGLNTTLLDLQLSIETLNGHSPRECIEQQEVRVFTGKSYAGCESICNLSPQIVQGREKLQNLF